MNEYQQFLLKLNGQLSAHFEPGHPPDIAADTATFYLKTNTPPAVIAHLNGNAAPVVRRAMIHKDAWGEDAPGQVVFETAPKPPGSTRPEPTPQPPDFGGNDPDDYQGIYHNPENAIIQPEKTEWSATQYYRREWRPLLGPTLSELVRELRQRCHFKSRRNGFETTYKSLAAALGVSEPTIKRAFQRDKKGRFKNEYLSYFIADIQTIRESNGKTIRTKGTRFLIYLDDTLTPGDRAITP